MAIWYAVIYLLIILLHLLQKRSKTIGRTAKGVLLIVGYARRPSRDVLIGDFFSVAVLVVVQ